MIYVASLHDFYRLYVSYSLIFAHLNDLIVEEFMTFDY